MGRPTRPQRFPIKHRMRPWVCVGVQKKKKIPHVFQGVASSPMSSSSPFWAWAPANSRLLVVALPCCAATTPASRSGPRFKASRLLSCAGARTLPRARMRTRIRPRPSARAPSTSGLQAYGQQPERLHLRPLRSRPCGGRLPRAAPAKASVQADLANLVAVARQARLTQRTCPRGP